MGYYSSAAFIRAFKRTEAVTPGSFKEIDPSESVRLNAPHQESL